MEEGDKMGEAWKRGQRRKARASLFSVCSISIPFQESGLYEYKTFGVMADLDPEICAQVYVDWEYRKVWDTYVLGQS